MWAASCVTIPFRGAAYAKGRRAYPAARNPPAYRTVKPPDYRHTDPPLPSHRPPHYRHTENWSETAKGLRSTGVIGVFSALNRLRKRLPYEPMYLIGEYAGAYRLRQRPRIPTETQNALAGSTSSPTVSLSA